MDFDKTMSFQVEREENTKTREILKRPESRFTVRVGNRLYVNKELFDEYLVKCAKYQIDI